MDRRRDQSIQGPRPTPLKITKDSHKIRKPPVAPRTTVPPPPVIIYSVSPKVIHTNPSGFMSLVQRLTGPVPTTTATTSTTDILSPAARLAMTEMTKMPLEGTSYDTGDGGFMQSILSPEPAGLIRPVPESFFLPMSDPRPQQQNSFLHQDYFNALHQQIQDGGGIGGAGGFSGGSIELLPSPTVGAFLSPNPIISPASIELLRRLLEQ